MLLRGRFELVITPNKAYNQLYIDYVNTNFCDVSNFFCFLDFGFDKHIYNVLEVNKTSYENCNEKDFIFNITKGGRDVFNLTEAKTYYFLSGRGFCFQGMKVAVFVEEYSPPPSTIISSPNLPKDNSNLSPSLKPLLIPFSFFLLIAQYFLHETNPFFSKLGFIDTFIYILNN